METIKRWLTNLSQYAFGQFLPSILILVIGIVIIALIRRIIKKLLKKSKLERAAHSLINSLVSVLLYLLLALIVASSLGIDVTGVVALASVLTLAVSLAVQNVLANLLGGLTLLSTNPFHAGDYVEIAGQSGTVKEVGLAYTKLTTPDNKEVSIPNNAVVSAEIVNYTINGTRRIEIFVSASYETPIPEVLDALREVAKQPAVLETPAPAASVKNYSEKAIDYQLFAWTKSGDFWGTKCKMLEDLKGIFDARGIELAYPHINVIVKK